MRAQDDSRDVALLGSQVTGVEAVKLFLVLTGRNAWHNTWCGGYGGSAALHCDLESAKGYAEPRRTQGTTFTIRTVPAVMLSSRGGSVVIVEFHTVDSFVRLDVSAAVAHLRSGSTVRDTLAVLRRGAGFWTGEVPKWDSFIPAVVGQGDVPVPLRARQRLTTFRSSRSGSRSSLDWSSEGTCNRPGSTLRVVDALRRATGSAAMRRMPPSADSLQIPVHVRRSHPLDPRSHSIPATRTPAGPPWPSWEEPPADGWWVADTTWREIVYSAIMVGRDPLPWLIKHPQLASQEIISRVSPLWAYLVRDAVPAASPARPHLRRSPVYTLSEASGRAAFGYRFGMTMADWLCTSQMGLGPTRHCEDAPYPAGAAPGWGTARSRPDLHGAHQKSGLPWLIEAKGGAMVKPGTLTDGAAQLARGSALLPTAHLKVLTAANLDPVVWMSVDIEEPPPLTSPPQVMPWPQDSPILDRALANLLTFQSLHLAPPQTRRIVTVGESALAPGELPWGGLSLLEHDRSTTALRSDPPDRARSRARGYGGDLLMAPTALPDLHIGMTRRLYSACAQLAALAAEAASRADRGALPLVVDGLQDAGSEDQRQGRLENEMGIRREQLAAWLRELGVELALQVEAAYERGGRTSWTELLDQEPETVELPGDFLEGVADDTYLAVRPPLGA